MSIFSADSAQNFQGVRCQCSGVRITNLMTLRMIKFRNLSFVCWHLTP